MEFYRARSRTQPLEDFHLEKVDKVLDLEGLLVTRESQEHIRRILGDFATKRPAAASGCLLGGKGQR